MYQEHQTKSLDGLGRVWEESCSSTHIYTHCTCAFQPVYNKNTNQRNCCHQNYGISIAEGMDIIFANINSSSGPWVSIPMYSFRFFPPSQETDTVSASRPDVKIHYQSQG